MERMQIVGVLRGLTVEEVISEISFRPEIADQVI
jgi:hypothetical protein